MLGTTLDPTGSAVSDTSVVPDLMEWAAWGGRQTMTEHLTEDTLTNMQKKAGATGAHSGGR